MSRIHACRRVLQISRESWSREGDALFCSTTAERRKTLPSRRQGMGAPLVRDGEAVPLHSNWLRARVATTATLELGRESQT
jgi:hypothetical protein